MSTKKRLIALSIFTLFALIVAGSLTHPGDASGAQTAAARDGLKVGLNFSWVLYTGALVLFMQAGFALLTTGLTRAKNAGHMMMINFAAFVFAFMGYYVIGFALNFGGVGQIANLGGTAPLHGSAGLGANWGLFGTRGVLLATGKVYDAGTLALFFFEVVFMETAGYIIIGAVAERISFSGLIAAELMIGALVYPVFSMWVWGGGWLSKLGVSMHLGHGAVDFAGSGVVHATGGIAAAALAIILGPRIGKFRKDGSPNAFPGHNLTYVVAGTFILLFGWMGFNPGSTLGASDLRISVIAVNTLIASCFGALTAIIWTNAKWGKPDISMACNGMLAGCVAITAGCAFVAPWAAAVIGFIAGFLVCFGVWFFDHKAKIDDPCGAISVHGICGIWGVLALGIFADGTYGAGWNGVEGGVRGLLYGGGTQFLAQLVYAATNIVWAFAVTYLVFSLIKKFVKVRVSADVEIEGLDMPEFGAVAYPEFVLHSTRGGGAGSGAPDGERDTNEEPVVFEGSRP
jgi:Amt family ammonium transporter